MTAALDLFRPDAGGNAGTDGDAGALPDFLDFRPARPPRVPRPSIRVFTDTLATPQDGRFSAYRIGSRATVEPCGPVPLFPGLYLVALRGAGFALARLRPTFGGGFVLSYDNPEYEGWTVTPGAVRRGDVQALCLIIHEVPFDYGDPNR